MIMAVSILLSLLAQPGASPDDLDDSLLRAMNLPSAVEIHAKAPPSERAPGMEFELRSAWNWSEFRQYLARGSLGREVLVAAHALWDDTLYVQMDTRSAVRRPQLSVYGRGTGEMGLTPIWAVRLLALIESRGGEVEKVELGDGHMLYRFTGKLLPPRIELEIDPASTTVVRTYFGGDDPSKPGWTEHFYEAWRDLPDGSHHPTRIRERLWGSVEGAEVEESVMVIDEMHLLDPSKVPARFELPDEFTIEDRIDGVLRNGAGEVIADLDDWKKEQDRASQSQSAGVRSRRNWMVGGGVLILILSGVVWQFKRRGVFA